MGSHILRLIGRHSCQDGQGSKCGRLLRGAAADVQGLLQADGHQQGWPAGQERPARRLRQRRCAHERVRARRSAGRDLRTLHLRQHGQDVPGEDGWRGPPTTSSCRPSRPTTTRARSTPRCSSTPPRPVEEAPEAEPEEDADAKKKKKKKKKAAK